MIIYADTSALAKLILLEEGTAEMRQLSGNSERTTSVAIAYVELHSALAAAVRAGRVPPDSRESTALVLEQIWSEVYEVAVDDPLLRQAARIAGEMRLRAYDAIHLAALIEGGDTDEITFACWDVDLRAAAQELGYRLFPIEGSA